jgi:hypothetical protein
VTGLGEVRRIIGGAIGVVIYAYKAKKVIVGLGVEWAIYIQL